MDQRGASASSHFLEDVPYPTERQIGFWKLNTVTNNQDKLAASSPVERFSVGCKEQPISKPIAGHEEKFGLSGKGVATNLPQTSVNVAGHPPNSWSNFGMQAGSNNSNGNKAINRIQHESGLFSSSMSEIFSRKLRLGNNILSQDRANKVASQLDDEPIELLEEIEAKTIGNLLPDEDDLFSGVIDELGLNSQTTREDELEDFDLFSMELEGEDRLCASQKDSNLLDAAVPNQGGSLGSLIGQHPYGEHPSRTLLVRNISSNVEDSELRTLFEQYGDIRTLHTACKPRGFVIISYYDIRAARNAMRDLQNKPMRRRKLDIHYSFPKEQQYERDVDQGTLAVFNLDSYVTVDELQRIFGVYGEVKEIHEDSQKNSHKLIVFYDVRAAEAAFRALNRTDIAGKQIILEPGRPGGFGRFLPQPEQEQDEATLAEGLHDGLSSGRLGMVASSYMDTASYQNFHTIIQSPVSSFIEPLRSSSVPIQLSSPARVAPIDKQYSLRELNQTLEEMKFGNQCIPNFHPHSLPEYHDAITNGNAQNSLDMASSLGIKMAEGPDGRHIRGVASNGHPMEPSSGVFGPSGNGSCPLQANHYIWSNMHQQHPTSAMIWPNSPTFVNGIHANRMPHMSAFARAPPVMMNAGSPVHHIGSAPPVNSPFWDRRHGYAGESPDTSGFHLGSLGSMGFPGRSPSHPVEIASHNIFSHVGGNGMDMSRTSAIHSPQQMSHLFPGRNPMISMPGSLDNPNERVRTFSHRRNDANSNNADKKQYELDIDRIKRGEDTRTTLMIKNIPNKYTSKMLLAAIDEHCRGTYDFIYLPIDFKNKCNVGYAFINMIDPQQIIPFHKAFNCKKWEKFNSEKVASLAYARIQGKSALIAHFQNSSLMNEDKRCRPILFHTDGPNAGDQEPFPMGANIRTRPGRSRASLVEESHLGGLLTSGNGEESSYGVDILGSSKDTN